MYLVVFRNRKRADIDAGAYSADAQAMAALATTQPGFLSFKSYTAEDGDACQEASNRRAVTIDGYEDVPQLDEVALKKAASKQPVSVAIQASQRSFQLYVGGVFDDKECGTQLDHGVLVRFVLFHALSGWVLCAVFFGAGAVVVLETPNPIRLPCLPHAQVVGYGTAAPHDDDDDDGGDDDDDDRPDDNLELTKARNYWIVKNSCEST